VNAASELVRKEIKFDHVLIFSHFKLKEASKAVECIPDMDMQRDKFVYMGFSSSKPRLQNGQIKYLS